MPARCCRWPQRLKPLFVIVTLARAWQPHGAAAIPNPRRKPRARTLQGLVAKDEKETPEGMVGRIDWDVFVDG